VGLAHQLLRALHGVAAVGAQTLERGLEILGLGLLAEGVDLRGDGRYWAQRGLGQLRQLNDRYQPPNRRAPSAQGNPQGLRSGVGALMTLCKRSGDRPTDWRSGVAARLRTFTLVSPDPAQGVELLTTREDAQGYRLAQVAEALHAPIPGLIRRLLQSVETHLVALDWELTPAIVLGQEGWPLGLLGILAQEVARLYQRPTVLFTLDAPGEGSQPLAYGCGCSLGAMDLRAVIQTQAPLLLHWGGSPLLPRLILPQANLPLVTAALQQALRHPPLVSPPRMIPPEASPKTMEPRLGLGWMLPEQPDLSVTMGDLNGHLFRDLRLLEPHGLGNPPPCLRVDRAQFTEVSQEKLRDHKNRDLFYPYVKFTLSDETHPKGIQGIWWGHDVQELPQEPCQAVVELILGLQRGSGKVENYQVRLLETQPMAGAEIRPGDWLRDWLLDWRTLPPEHFPALAPGSGVQVLRVCPRTWEELQHWIQGAMAQGQRIALAYDRPRIQSALDCWQQLRHWSQEMATTGQGWSWAAVAYSLGIRDRTLAWGGYALEAAGLVWVRSAGPDQGSSPQPYQHQSQGQNPQSQGQSQPQYSIEIQGQNPQSQGQYQPQYQQYSIEIQGQNPQSQGQYQGQSQQYSIETQGQNLQSHGQSQGQYEGQSQGQKPQSQGQSQPQYYCHRRDPLPVEEGRRRLAEFLRRVEADRFQQEYFCRSSLDVLARSLPIKPMPLPPTPGEASSNPTSA